MSRSDKVSVACVFVAMMMLVSGLAMTVVTPQSAQGLTAEAQSPSAPAAVLPGAPQGLTVDQGDGMLWLWWDHPLSQGSELIKWYDIYRGDSPTTLNWRETYPVGSNFFEDWEVVNDQTYYYAITAYSDVGNGPQSDVVSGTPTTPGIIPSAPQNVVALNHVSSAKLSWSAPLNQGSAPVRSYDIYRGATPGSLLPYATVDWKTLEYEDMYAYPGFDYSYAVIAQSIVAEGPFSATTTVHIGGTGSIPSAPWYLSAYVGDGGVLLYWGESENPSMGGVLRYDVFRGASSGGEGSIPIGNVTRSPDGSYWFTYYGDMDVVNDVMYWYFVKAVGTGGSSAPSQEVFAVPSQVGVRPDAPSITAYAGNDQVLLNYAANRYMPGYVVNITGLEIYRSTVSGSPGSLWASVMPNTAHAWDNTASNGVTYYYSIRSLWASNSSSSEFSAQIDATPAASGDIPAAPSDLWTNPRDSSVLLSIEGNEAPTPPIVLGYEIYRSATPGGVGTLIDTVSYDYPQGDLSWYDTTTTAFTTYYYRVKAIGFYGTSGLSNEGHAFSSYSGDAPTAPLGLAGSATEDVVHLTWSFPSYLGTANFIYFEVYVNNGSGEWFNTAGISGYPGDSPSIYDRYLDPGTYHYRVLAGNNYGDSAYSNEVTVTVTGGTVPDAPTGLSATPGNAKVDLSWTAPNNGGSPIQYYIVYQNGVDVGHPTGVSTTIGGLTNGVTYSFTVAAHNAVGTGDQSSARSATPLATVPDAPTGLNVIPGNEQVIISWAAPADGGSPIDYYVIYKNGIASAYPLVPSTTMAGLTNGVTYTFIVAAHNAIGFGANSSSITATPRAVPGAPTGLNGAPGDKLVNLNWVAPTDTGGAPIDYYIVFQDGVDVAHPTGVSTIISGLTNGVTYSFNVAAHNAVGPGPESNGIGLMPRSLPDAPTGFAASPANGQVALNWTAPVNSGGLPITYYVIYQDGADVAHPTGVSTIISGLTNGVTYSFTVATRTGAGIGIPSAPVSATPVAVPGPPTGLVAAPDNAQVTLNWTAPSDTGGSPIQYYIVFQDGVDIAHPTALSTSVSGLTNGVTYSFTVLAHSSIGSGQQSSAATATPHTVPGAPTGLNAVAGNAQVELNWTAPADTGGAAISYYVVYRDGVDVAHPTGLTATISGLTNGVSYEFTVAAHNVAGNGAPSAPVSATPVATVPGAPTLSAPMAGNLKVTLSWTAPSNTGGSPLTGYKVFYGTSSPSTQFGDVLGPSILNVDVIGLTPGTTYFFAVKAVNAIGDSALSNVLSSTPFTTANAPTGLVAVPGNAQVTLTWVAPANTGGAAIDYYIVYRNGTDVSHPTGLTTIVTGLANGVEYQFTVAAHNAAGIGALSAAVSATPNGPTVPGAPGNLLAAAGLGKVDLTWTAAVSSTTITRYDIFRGTSEGSIGTTPIASVAGSVLAYSDMAIVGGTTYYYNVKATNSVGTGPASETEHATPTATVPGAPQNVAATPGVGKVTVNWTAPSSNGGSAITGYKIYRALAGGAVNIANVSASTLNYVDGSGTAGTTYVYYVVATNAVGAGANSAQVSAAPQAASATDNTMLYVGIAIAVIAVIAIVVVLMRRKK